MKVIQLDDFAQIRYYPEDQIIAVIYEHSIVVDDKIVRRVVETAIDLVESEKFGLLVDIRNILYVTKEGRELSSELEKDRIIASAIVLNDAINRELFNIFQNFHKPPYPTKAFTDFDKAYEWLKQKDD